jgi:hypothetical protein
MRKQISDGGAGGAQTRVEFEEFDRTLKDELVKHYYNPLQSHRTRTQEGKGVVPQSSFQFF